ncbi:hypothetical protein [uncultured Ellagibacter sp.]|uniref:hypothetical protein n=1 Tax=uncultured Ellagibacter sp. TaxID=2137580 RepID=UPI00261794D5|nr:hypothetical protein [uncultured Ellagibacter sp.]
MVTYELVRRNESTLVYEYWPENDRGSRPGKVFVDLANETVSLGAPTERDLQRCTTGRDMNAMRDGVTEMRQERGEPLLFEEELPTEPDDAVYRWWWYYDHVQRDFSRRHDEGKIPERGMVAWH